LVEVEGSGHYLFIPIYSFQSRGGFLDAFDVQEKLTSGAEARFFRGSIGTAEQAAEKCCLLEKRRTPAAKAGPIVSDLRYA
jgi:hypothetical protein